MKSRNFHAAWVGLLTAVVVVPAAAQQDPGDSVDVTFQVPVSLTQLPPAIEMIAVRCVLNSSALSRDGRIGSWSLPNRHATVEIPVAQGTAAHTAQVTIALTYGELYNPSGKQATWECRPFATRAEAGGGYRQTTDLTGVPPGQTDTTFVVTPKPAPIAGSFVW